MNEVEIYDIRKALKEFWDGDYVFVRSRHSVAAIQAYYLIEELQKKNQELEEKLNKIKAVFKETNTEGKNDVSSNTR